MKNNDFWKAVDLYESGKITKDELYNYLKEKNKGNLEKTDADFKLALCNE